MKLVFSAKYTQCGIWGALGLLDQGFESHMADVRITRGGDPCDGGKEEPEPLSPIKRLIGSDECGPEVTSVLFKTK